MTTTPVVSLMTIMDTTPVVSLMTLMNTNPVVFPLRERQITRKSLSRRLVALEIVSAVLQLSNFMGSSFDAG